MCLVRSRLSWFHFLLALPSLALSSQSSKDRPPAHQAEKAFLIDPQRNVGQITPTCSERDLIRIYGSRNVRRASIDVGEGETERGTILFPGTPDAVEILWKRPFSHPLCLIISSPKTRWRTTERITVGTTAEKIERINRFPFRLTGFSWDYEGRSMSWGKGKLAKELVLDFLPTCKVSVADERAVTGDGIFSSAHPSMLRKKLTVVSIRIFWD